MDRHDLREPSTWNGPNWNIDRRGVVPQWSNGVVKLPEELSIDRRVDDESGISGIRLRSSGDFFPRSPPLPLTIFLPVNLPASGV